MEMNYRSSKASRRSCFSTLIVARLEVKVKVRAEPKHVTNLALDVSLCWTFLTNYSFFN